MCGWCLLCVVLLFVFGACCHVLNVVMCMLLFVCCCVVVACVGHVFVVVCVLLFLFVLLVVGRRVLYVNIWLLMIGCLVAGCWLSVCWWLSLSLFVGSCFGGRLLVVGCLLSYCIHLVVVGCC